METINFELAYTAFDEYFQMTLRENKFIVKEFVNFMEKKFTAAGYRNSPKIGEPLNVLIIHDAGIGDFVLMSGAIREIRRLYPTAHITLVVNGGSVVMAENCPYINELIPLEDGRTHFDEMFKSVSRMAKKILTRRIDICFAYIHRAWTPFLLYMSGAKIRISHKVNEIDGAYLFSRNDIVLKSLQLFATDFVPMFVSGNHMADAFFSPLDVMLKIPVANRDLEIWFTPLDAFLAKNILTPARRPIYALSMGGMEMMKHYPPEKYAQLVQRIIEEEPTATFIIFGGGKIDFESAQIFRQNLTEKIFSSNVIDMTNRLNFRQCAAVLSFCDAYMGNDTGVMHIAAACKCPVLEPNCFAASLPRRNLDYVRLFSPYKVPSVIVQPQNTLDDCKTTEPYDSMGCRVNKPHCITQIDAATLFHGYKLLKEQIAQKVSTPIFIS